MEEGDKRPRSERRDDLLRELGRDAKALRCVQEAAVAISAGEIVDSQPAVVDAEIGGHLFAYQPDGIGEIRFREVADAMVVCDFRLRIALDMLGEKLFAFGRSAVPSRGAEFFHEKIVRLQTTLLDVRARVAVNARCPDRDAATCQFVDRRADTGIEIAMRANQIEGIKMQSD